MTDQVTYNDPDTGQAAQIRALNDEVTNLRNTIALTRNQLAEERYKPQQIVTCIGERLIKIATDNDYCSTYDSEVEEANEELADKWGVRLPLRKRLVEKNIVIEGTMTVHTTVWIDESNPDADATDPDYWLNEDGSESGIDIDDLLSEQSENESFDSIDITINRY
jgi:hypothetical protein